MDSKTVYLVGEHPDAAFAAQMAKLTGRDVQAVESLPADLPRLLLSDVEDRLLTEIAALPREVQPNRAQRRAAARRAAKLKTARVSGEENR